MAHEVATITELRELPSAMVGEASFFKETSTWLKAPGTQLPGDR